MRIRKTFQKKAAERGFITIEACVIVPVLISSCFFVLALLLQFFRRDALQLAFQKEIYLISLAAEETCSSAMEISGKLGNDGLLSPDIPGRAEHREEDEAARILCVGRVTLISEDTVTVSREVRCCTDRLRRWQFYDDLTKGQGE